MATLTSRTLATGVTLSDLIHIVITGDTSQNPEGSSYKATIGQVLDLFSVSANTYVTGGTYDNNTGTATFTNNQGGEFDVTGFYTGGTDIYVTGGTYSAGTATFTNNTGGTFDVTGFYTGGLIQFSTTGISTNTFLSWDYNFYGVNSTSGPVSLFLPSTSGRDGQIIIIKDESGSCASNSITLTPTLATIDGQPSVQMNINFMSLTIIVRNGNWFLI